MNIFKLKFKADPYPEFALGDKAPEEIAEAQDQPVEAIEAIEGIDCWLPVHKETGLIHDVHEPYLDEDDLDVAAITDDFELKQFTITPVE